MSALRQRMLEEMQLRRYTKTTQEAYLYWVSEIAKHYPAFNSRFAFTLPSALNA